MIVLTDNNSSNWMGKILWFFTILMRQNSNLINHCPPLELKQIGRSLGLRLISASIYIKTPSSEEFTLLYKLK